VIKHICKWAVVGLSHKY